VSRCKKHRCCRLINGEIIYRPIAVPLDEGEITIIAPDEFEAMRLCDLDGLSQITAGARMEVSRGTVQRLLVSGRRKVIAALLNGGVIRINNQEGERQHENLHSDHGQ